MTSAPPPANLRDVGGLRSDDGRTVRSGVLYRSELPHYAGQPDLLPVWPPAAVIDLRLPFERHSRHPLAGADTVVHTAIVGIPAAAPGTSRATDPDLTWILLHLLPSVGDEIARIVRIVADAPGPVLVHCTVGKDRTGIVVALLLRAAGVRHDDVLADYLRTGDDLPRLWNTLRTAGVGPPHNPGMAGVQREAIEAVLAEVEGAPGGLAGWLASRGVSTADLRRLTDRLVA
ncbi:tyrosine-protein phosphatase [Pseudonocardia sp. GCM10023141]|uniref:tyrosine-protein phosphatase n=1 Tax=Pseudonocardia sp. GCM10023141 TaxID=3252653 RepID=UPI00361A9623